MDGRYVWPDTGWYAGAHARRSDADLLPELLLTQTTINQENSGFPTEALGVRLTYSNSDHDAYGSSDLVGLSANWFFVRNAAVEIELIRAGSARGYLPGSRDLDSLGVRLLGRF